MTKCNVALKLTEELLLDCNRVIENLSKDKKVIERYGLNTKLVTWRQRDLIQLRDRVETIKNTLEK